MTDLELEFRPARPEDAPAAVPLLYSSGPAAMEYVLGREASRSPMQFMEYAFRDGAGETGYRNHTVVTHAGQIVGAGACFSGENAFPFLISAIRQLLTFYGPLRGIAVIRRGLEFEHLVKPPSRSMHYIGHLGVPEIWQGRGVGRRMIEHFLEIGRRRNRSKAVLDVSVENPRALALYEQIGFRTTEELISTLPGVPDHRRMELSLS